MTYTDNKDEKKNWYNYIFCELESVQRADSLKMNCFFAVVSSGRISENQSFKTELLYLIEKKYSDQISG